jgi:hypothetical protein
MARPLSKYVGAIIKLINDRVENTLRMKYGDVNALIGEINIAKEIINRLIEIEDETDDD